MDIEHRTNIFLTDADYWSRLGIDLCFDPLLKSYIEHVNSFRQSRPSPSTLPPAPKNMPYFHGPRLLPQVASPDASLPGVHHSTPVDNAPTIGLQYVSNYTVRFGKYIRPRPAHAHSNKRLYNSDLTVAASILSKFDWAMYRFNNGHFSLTITELGMPFEIVLACDPYANDRTLFTEISSCPTILSSALALLDHIRASGNTALLASYLIHSHRYMSTEPTHCF
jgi:hypothetical protein